MMMKAAKLGEGQNRKGASLGQLQGCSMIKASRGRAEAGTGQELEKRKN